MYLLGIRLVRMYQLDNKNLEDRNSLKYYQQVLILLQSRGNNNLLNMAQMGHLDQL